MDTTSSVSSAREAMDAVTSAGQSLPNTQIEWPPSSLPSGAEQANSWGFYVPLVMLAIFAFVAFSGWQWLKKEVAEKLRKDLRTRKTLHFVIAAILPLGLGWFFDVLNFSTVIEAKKATQTQGIQLTILAGFVVAYLLGHWALSEADSKSQDIEERLGRQLSNANFAYRHFANVLSHLQSYLDANGEELNSRANLMSEGGGSIALMAGYPEALFEKNLENLCRAIRSGVAVPEGAQTDNAPAPTIGIALFRLSGNLLDYVYSYSMRSHFAKPMWEQHKSYFELSSTHESTAKRAVMTDAIVVTEDCESSHKNEQDPFYYFGTSADPRSMLKSLVTIPVKVDEEFYCVCLSASSSQVFMNDQVHKNFYLSLQEEVRARIRLLHIQRRFLRAFCDRLLNSSNGGAGAQSPLPGAPEALPGTDVPGGGDRA